MQYVGLAVKESGVGVVLYGWNGLIDCEGLAVCLFLPGLVGVGIVGSRWKMWRERGMVALCAMERYEDGRDGSVLLL